MKVYIGPYPGMRSKKERRVSVRIDKYDTWNMDSTLAHIIIPMLIQLKESKHGIPGVMFPDLPEGRWEHTDDEDDAARKKWDDILDCMIYSFKAVLNDYNSDVYHIADDNAPPLTVILRGEDGSEKEEAWPMKTRYDSEKHKEELDKIQKGFDYFGKYYMNLWD